MMDLPIPPNENERIRALKSYDILDSAAEEEFDRITQLASLICDTPISLVSLVDETRQWFKSKQGLDVSQTPRSLAFCQYAILSDKLFEIEDATRDARFVNNALVTGDPNIRFYAGSPLVDKDGCALGTLCVIDREPRELNEKQKKALELLAHEVTSLIVERREKEELRNFEQLFNLSGDLICVAGLDGFFKKINPAFKSVLGWDRKVMLSTSFFDLVHPDDIGITEKEIENLASGQNTINFVNRFRTESGTYRTLQWVAAPEPQTGSLFAIGRDISEEKKQEELLIHSEAKLRAFFENSQGLMCTHDLEGKFLTVNSAGAKILGYQAEELKGLSLFNVIPPSRHDALRDYLQEVATTGMSKGQMVTRHKDGGYRILLYNNVLKEDIDGSSYVIGNAIDITERYQLEEALRHTKETLEQTSKIAKIGSWEIDLVKGKITWSEITYEIHGMDPDFVPEMESGINFYKEGESRNKISAAVKAAIDEGIPWDLELQIINNHGAEVWVRAIGTPEFKDGVCKRVFGTFQDINEGKMAALELARSKKLLTDVMHAASEISIIATDLNGTINVFNSGAEKLVGYSAKEVIGKHNPGLFHDADEVAARGLELSKEYDEKVEGFQVFIRKLSTQASEQRIWTYIHKNGARSTVSLIVTAVRDIDNEIIGYLGIATDITEKRKVEEALTTERARLSAFVKHAPAAVAMLDTNMRYIEVSNRWLEDYKMAGKNVIGLSYHNVFVNDDNERASRHERVLGGAIERKEEDTYRLEGDTEDQYVTWEMRPWYRFDNSIGGIMLFTQNITNIIKQREELILAKQLAEQASVAKSEFLANMSHEIRTPLNGIIGFTDLVLKTNMNETQQQYLTIVNQSANALLTIINDILDFSKIEAGKLELEVEKFDLYEMCAEATDIITYQVQAKGLEMLLNISPELPRFIYGDSVRLKQILVNLLGNASKFTDKGEIELKVELISREGGVSTIRMGVRDTGIGIPTDKQQKIFDAFSQADGSTTKKYGGTGLGLTISNKLLGLMNSKLLLSSTPGKGSWFYFEASFEAEDGAAVEWDNLDNIHEVLVVDDNDNNRLILRQMLLLKNIKTVEAVHGLAALQLLAEGNRYDVILMDYHMPYMDGLETIKKIRENFFASPEEQPIILLYSSSNDEKVMRACDELQVNHRLVKPIKMQDIFYTLSHLQKKKSVTSKETDTSVSSANIFTVLIAEDNTVNMLLNRTIIKKIAPNCNLLEAKNGLEAVAFCKQQLPDLILMDIQMPEMNGYEATKEIRTNSAVHLPIIALTAGNVKGEREKCLAAGMDDFVVKPIVEETIISIFNKWLDKFATKESIEASIIEDRDTAHFNLEKLKSYLGSDEEVIQEMCLLIRSELQEALNNLRKGLKNKDLTELNRVGHKLYGTAASSGLKILSGIAHDLEVLQPFSEKDASTLVNNVATEVLVVLELMDKSGY